MRQISAGIIVGARELEEALLTALQELPVRVLFEISEIPEDETEFRERIERMRPDVVILDGTRLRDPLDVVIQRIRSAKGPAFRLVMAQAKGSGGILAAFRAGATEFLFPPFDKSLKNALERIAK